MFCPRNSCNCYKTDCFAYEPYTKLIIHTPNIIKELCPEIDINFDEFFYPIILKVELEMCKFYQTRTESDLLDKVEQLTMKHMTLDLMKGVDNE